MAYLVRRGGETVEIRESRATPRGPRSRQLARFSGPLTPAVLASAASAASRPFDEQALRRRAEVMGVPAPLRAPEHEARALLARLRRDDPIDPAIAGLLLRALEDAQTQSVPEHLADAAEWIGASSSARGAALRDLLDAFGRIAASRPPRRMRPHASFPHFSSNQNAAAS